MSFFSLANDTFMSGALKASDLHPVTNFLKLTSSNFLKRCLKDVSSLLGCFPCSHRHSKCLKRNPLSTTYSLYVMLKKITGSGGFIIKHHITQRYCQSVHTSHSALLILHNDIAHPHNTSHTIHNHFHHLYRYQESLFFIITHYFSFDLPPFFSFLSFFMFTVFQINLRKIITIIFHSQSTQRTEYCCYQTKIR